MDTKEQLKFQRMKMKAWNNKRAKNERNGINKFWKLKETFKLQSLLLNLKFVCELPVE